MDSAPATSARISDILRRTKVVLIPMSWSKRLNRQVPVWYEFRSPLEFEDDRTSTPEALYIIGQWSPGRGVIPETWGFGLFWGDARIYAIDVQPLGRHKNSIGIGRPFFRKVIGGIHEHTWSDEGQGYAEPLEFDEPMTGKVIWARFIAGAGITDPGFSHSDKVVHSGQGKLDL